MNIQQMIEKAVTGKPPRVIANYCGLYYSPYYYLMHLIAQRQAEMCVELGVETGRGLVALASAGMDVRVVGIEERGRPELGIVTARFPNVEIHIQSSTPAFDLGQPIDLLHIDTEHSYTRARDEFRAWEPYLAPGAVVLFDDLNAMEGDVARFFDELPHEKYRNDDLHPTCGYGVVVYDPERA